MDEQIILSVDLYDNVLTEKQGDYTGKPRITDSSRYKGRQPPGLTGGVPPKKC